MRFNEFKESDYEIHDRAKLDKILLELCYHIIEGQRIDSDNYGMVAACVLDPKNRRVYGVNEAAGDNKRRHAERVAIDRYVENYGEVPKGSIIITTLSPCNEDHTEMADGRYGESCTDLVNSSNCRKVYCGYIDPTQQDEHNKYTLEETDNIKIKGLCEKFANTFLELSEDWQKVNKKDKTDGMSSKAVKAYRRENPGSKLKTAVTTKPSKLKAGSKDAKRRKSFCARMSGNKGPMKDKNGKPTPKAKALARWNCR